MSIPKVSIFGVPFSQLNFQDTVKLLTEAVRTRKPTHVITANPIMVMEAQGKPDYLDMMKRAELIVPDGAGIVWAAGYIGNPVAEKVAGIELLNELFRLGEEKGWKVFLLGASEEVIQEAANRLKGNYPKIQLVGVRNGFFKSDQDEEVIREILAAEPDLLFVGRGADTQEPWIDQYKSRMKVPVMMGVGGSFDIVAGKLKRAPKLFIKLRLEWFYRLLQEPWRYKRMLVLPKFMLKVVREKENVQKP